METIATRLAQTNWSFTFASLVDAVAFILSHYPGLRTNHSEDAHLPSRAYLQLVALPLLVANMSVAWARDVVAERGYERTTVDQELVERVLVRTNLLLSGTGIRLMPSWRADSGSGQDGFPVYLVKSAAKGPETPAAVPYGCTCVFVNPTVLADWVASNSSGSGRLELDRGNFLVFVLLHEAGHLAKSTPAAVFERGDVSQLNIEPSKAKAAEEGADDFAAEVLKRRARQAQVNEVSIDANWVVNELTKLSWNMQAFRSLDEFSAFAVGKPSVFFDNGYSHPNLSWRILRVNYLIQQSKEARYLLDSFEDARRRGADPKPLYQRK